MPNRIWTVLYLYFNTMYLCTITKKHIVQRKLEQTSYQYYWGYLSGCWGQINGSRSCRERDRREWEKVNSKTRMCVLGCGRLGWAALVPGHRAVVGIYARSPVTDIVLLSTRTHIYISTYLHIYIYRATYLQSYTLCLPGTRRGWTCVLTAYKDPQTSDLPTGLPSASVGTRVEIEP